MTGQVGRSFPPARIALETPGFRVAAVHYWQGNWNYNFWSSLKESRLDSDFRRIRALSFNTVITSVPWGYFQSNAFPPAYDERAFKKLDLFLDRAADHHLYVILRVGTPELVPDGIVGGSYWVPFMMYEDRELAAYADLYRELASRIGSRENLLFVFGSWEDIGLLGPLKLPRKDREKRAGRPASFIDFLRREPIEHWNERWGTDFASVEDVYVPDEGTPAAWDFLTFADERLMQVVLPRVEKAAHQGNPDLRLGFEIRVDAEPIWFDGKKHGPKWFFHRKTWNLPVGYEVICAYFNPSWKAPNDGGFIDPRDAARNLRRLLDEIDESTDGRPVFFDQYNFIDSTPYFKRNSRLRDEEAVARFLELSLPDIYRRSLGYAVWSFQAYEADILYNSTFEDGLDGWVALEQVPGTVHLVEDRERQERCVRIEPGGAIRQAVRAGWNPGVHSPDVPYTLRAMVRGEEGSRLEVRYEVPAAGAGGATAWTNVMVKTIDPPAGWQQIETELPFSPNIRLTLASTGGAALEIDELALFNHVQTAAVYGPRGEALGRRAEVLGRINREWLERIGQVERTGATSWSKEDLAGLEGVFDDGWVGGRLSVPIYVPWVRARLHLSFYLPKDEVWQEGNRYELRLDGARVFTGRIETGTQEIDVPLPDLQEPGPRTLRLTFDRVVCPARDAPPSTDERHLAAVLLGIQVLEDGGLPGHSRAVTLEGVAAGQRVPVTVHARTAQGAAAAGCQVLAHVMGGPVARGRTDANGVVRLDVVVPATSAKTPSLFVELLDDDAVVAELSTDG